MLPLDPQRVAELQRRLAARQLREEDFEILPDLLEPCTTSAWSEPGEFPGPDAGLPQFGRDGAHGVDYQDG